MPVISEHTMKYKKALTMFQSYEVTMEVVGWDDRVFNMSHTFWVNGRPVAEGTSQGVIVGKNGVVAPSQVMQTVADRLGVSAPDQD